MCKKKCNNSHDLIYAKYIYTFTVMFFLFSHPAESFSSYFSTEGCYGTFTPLTEWQISQPANGFTLRTGMLGNYLTYSIFSPQFNPFNISKENNVMEPCIRLPLSKSITGRVAWHRTLLILLWNDIKHCSKLYPNSRNCIGVWVAIVRERVSFALFMCMGWSYFEAVVPAV